MRLIITRHGETEENKAGILQGHLPGTLSAEGIEQAKKVALRLKDVDIDCIYSSDLARSADTAKEIAAFHPDAPITFLEDLRERGIGSWQGRKKSEFRNATEEELQEVETLEGLFNRAATFLSSTRAKHSSDTVLLVAHNKVNRALIAALTNKTHHDIDSVESQHNTSVNIFEIEDDGQYQTLLSNDIGHLSS